MGYRIVFIAPFKKMADLMVEVAKDIGIEVKVYIGNLEEGAKIAYELEEKEEVDVIISRGGTALAIANMVKDTPVVEIQISGYDLIKVVSQVRQKSNRIAVMGFDPFTYGTEELGDIMNVRLKVLTLNKKKYKETDYIERVLTKTKDDGYNFLVGDYISVTEAKKLGINARLIRSGKEAITQALTEAKKIAIVRRNEMEKARRNQSIIDFAHEGIISIDSKGIIKTFNNQAEKIFTKKAYKEIGKNISEVLPELELLEVIKNGFKEQGKICKVGDINIVINAIPIKINEEVVGAVATFQEASRIEKVENKLRKQLYLKGYIAENTFEDIIGESEAIVYTKEEGRDYAQVDLPLLIYGETGTGKELFAQAVHNASSRHSKPFVALNCAALPENLLESELFGYVKGAFTGAVNEGKPGLFEQAYGGTVFLDEFGEISQSVQAKLLRVLQENKVRRLGDNKLTPVDVRIIVATNQSLIELIEENKFRKDLFYRINVLNLNLPPLRKRKEDISLLVKFFLEKVNLKINKRIKGINDKGMEILKNYHWPGNIRQLENVIEKLVVRTRGNYIKNELVMETIKSLERYNISGNKSPSLNLFSIDFSKEKSLEEIERQIIKYVVKSVGDNKTEAAKKLGIGRTTLWRKLREK